MSGGVDSSVAAALLSEQGYACHGVMLIMHGNEAIEDAAAVCGQLNIPFYTIDAKEQFRTCVVSDFIDSYKEGETPNPCVRCNNEVKLSMLLTEADKRGLDYIATGHYARVTYASCDNRRNLLYKGKDTQKDQSYMLYRLSQKQLGRLLLPLGDYDKNEVRRIADRLGLTSAGREDSQDLCFVPDGDYVSFIEREIGKQEPGAIVNKKGEILGTHNGLINYTVGQRKGLGIAMGEPYYVIRKDKELNEVVLGKESDLYTDSVRVRDINLIAAEEIAPGLEVEIQTRYRATAVKARLRQLSDAIIVAAFDKREKAPAPGQSAVFYQGDLLVGGGIVEDSMDKDI